MAEIKLQNGRMVGDAHPPYIIAEFNTSHGGSADTAKSMIESAKEIGCDCVKFQSWSAETLYSKTYYDQNPIAKRIVKKFAFGEDVLKELAAYCRTVGIDFASTPYSRAEVDALIELGVPFIKISSMELNHFPFLEYIGGTMVPIILSTGMGDTEEIIEAVHAVERTGNHNICLLHCVSIYPAEPGTVNLRNITGFEEQFPRCAIGFSDHTLGAEMSIAAVALGANVIEKHFTLDKTKIGMDNQIALEPAEMKALVDGCRNVFQGLGIKERVVTRAELEQRVKMRRSIVAARDLPAGMVITENDLDAKRPGTGIAPGKLGELLGKTVKTEIHADEIITEDEVILGEQPCKDNGAASQTISST
jgi:N-acetylneuraminate synthase